MKRIINIFSLIALLILVPGCNLFHKVPARPAPLKSSKPSPALLAYFPLQPKTQWFYEGFAEYGHKMTLDSVADSSNGSRKVLNISGLVDDPSGGASKRNFHFKLQYAITANSIFETVVAADTPFPHRFKNLKVLCLPLQKGAKWKQNVVVNGKKAVLIAEILGYKSDPILKVKTLPVRYRVPMPGMPNGVYEEIREFAWKKGIYHFEKTFDTNPENRFQYTLREIKIPGKK